MNRTIWAMTTAAALAAAAAVGGCKSDDSRETDIDTSADLIDHNRLLVRLALAENVYNGVAAERAIYPKDFDAASASLNNLGIQRVEHLVAASRDTGAPIVIVRGDASDELYAARVDAVRQELIDSGFQANQIALVKDTHVGGGALPSDRALMSYDRLMSDYAATPGGGAGDGNAADRRTRTNGGGGGGGARNN